MHMHLYMHSYICTRLFKVLVVVKFSVDCCRRGGACVVYSVRVLHVEKTITIKCMYVSMRTHTHTHIVKMHWNVSRCSHIGHLKLQAIQNILVECYTVPRWERCHTGTVVPKRTTTAASSSSSNSACILLAIQQYRIYLHMCVHVQYVNGY